MNILQALWAKQLIHVCCIIISYVFIALTPNIKGTDSSIFSIYRLTQHIFHHIQFYIIQLFATLENNALRLGLVKEYKVLHSSSPSLPTSINSNYYKHTDLFVLYWKTYNISLGLGSRSLIQHSTYMSFSTPPLVLYFPYSTCTGALTK